MWRGLYQRELSSPSLSISAPPHSPMQDRRRPRLSLTAAAMTSPPMRPAWTPSLSYFRALPPSYTIHSRLPESATWICCGGTIDQPDGMNYVAARFDLDDHRLSGLAVPVDEFPRVHGAGNVSRRVDEDDR